MYRLLNCVVWLHLAISSIFGYDRRGVSIVTVIVGDNPVYGYFIQSPDYDVALARALRTFPTTLSQVKRLSVYKPGTYSCPEAAALMPILAMEVDQLIRDNPRDFTVLITPGCSLEVIALGDFAREWDVPLMAVIAIDLSLTDTQRFPTVLTFPSSDQSSLVRATLALFERYSWSTVSLLCGDVNPSGADNTLFYATTCSGFINALEQSSQIDALNVFHFDARTADNEGYENMLKTVGMQSRVVLLLVPTARRLRDIMVTADTLNMTKGDYIFIAPRSPAVFVEGALQWRFNVTSDDQAFAAFQSLITVSNPLPQWKMITALMDEIRSQSQLVYNRTLTMEDSVNGLTVSAVEVMSSVTEVLSQFSSRQLKAMTGTDFRKHFLNRTFELESRSFFIGPKGMRVCDVDLYKMNVTNGEMEVVWEYKLISDTLRQTSRQNVIWRSRNGPPLNRPVCGFRGDRCIGSLEKSVVTTVAPILTVLVSFIFGAGIFWFFHQRTKGSVWWLLEEMRLISAVTHSNLGTFQSVQRS
ncbi:hypothetical protein BV898_13366 [Hypsibius exemplaris]|uniref:Receptor ligand binding region domain-containing protein n=1 Tax=Hypsibius exemplaris TaxID=2072580 RepID=A0A1W0WAY1_HYPEX|nr:hypothetical protein BV898_13366 [Hypsibius exemplaris]